MFEEERTYGEFFLVFRSGHAYFRALEKAGVIEKNEKVD